MKTIHFPSLMLATATKSNVSTVNAIFEKFGQGDLPGILEMCADNCMFHHGGDPSVIPFAKPFHGKQGAAAFFMTIAQNINVTSLAPSNFRESGNTVLHDFHVEATVLATGKSYAADVLYEWDFDENGQISAHRSTGDFTEAEAAFKA